MVDEPGTQGAAAATTQLLDEAECLRLIAAGGVGRIGYTGRFGPTILPVNFALQDQTIVFRTGPGQPDGRGPAHRDSGRGVQGGVRSSTRSARPRGKAGAFSSRDRPITPTPGPNWLRRSDPACRPGQAARKTCSSALSRTVSLAAASAGRHRRPKVNRPAQLAASDSGAIMLAGACPDHMPHRAESVARSCIMPIALLSWSHTRGNHARTPAHQRRAVGRGQLLARAAGRAAP